MPTPSADPVLLSPPLDPQYLRSSHALCPPEEGRQRAQLPPVSRLELGNAAEEVALAQQATPPADDGVAGSPDPHDGTDSTSNAMDVDGERLVRDTRTPMSAVEVQRAVAQGEAQITAPRTPTSPWPIPYGSMYTERSEVRVRCPSQLRKATCS